MKPHSEIYAQYIRLLVERSSLRDVLSPGSQVILMLDCRIDELKWVLGLEEEGV